MNVAQAPIGSYFLLGAGDGYVYEKFGDNGTLEHPKPVVYKYGWNQVFVGGLEPDPSTDVHLVGVVVRDPGSPQIITHFEPGEFFLRDTEPSVYYQYFAGEQDNKVLAFKFDRATSQFLDVVLISDHESVRPLDLSFVLANNWF